MKFYHHCFEGTIEELTAWQQLPTIIFGVSGKFIRDNTGLEVIPRIPPHQLVLETDSPFLSPFAWCPVNHPWNLPVIAAKIEINCKQHDVQQSAKVNAVKTHSTPLHEAALKQDIDFLGLLLEYGADVYARNNKGLHAIDLISSSTNPSKELLLYWMNTVPKLTYLTRQVIRRQLGQAGLMNVDQLMLPKFLKNYVEHR
ncbi:unnamed protein product [Mytilus coruscus]|uniref:SOCS box domain-containing protein n=1 Tax=Mytilus coruscus TaxID=42192 RepID=A0A6J8DNR9_MYTCO|nr:unnamed protein product [Mytilus coruscus]